MLIRFVSLFIALFAFTSFAATINAQQNPDPNRFQQDVTHILERYENASHENAVLFTGSSSIRGWNSLESTFPEHTILNTGFGGSHASDLLYFIEDLILQYSPQKVFIYEGDNDISSGKSGESIVETVAIIVSEIHERLPESEIILISAKPSISRWHLADEYRHLNQLFNEFSANHDRVFYANIWDVMIGENGEPMQQIFMDDDLHINQEGYDLWADVIRTFLD